MIRNGKFVARALVVDDEPAVREILEERLRQSRFDCWSCSSGEEALALLNQEAFDVVLSDLSMTGMSGIDLLRATRAKYPGTAFILVTGTQDVHVGIEAMKQGASDYLTKPFQLGAVVHNVEQALDKKRLERELDTYRQRLEQMVEERTAQLRTALREVEEAYRATLEALGAALDLRDSATEGHCGRVTRYAALIAQAMGCSDAQVQEIARGAYLHDIGKIGIPDEVLLKQGKLDPREKLVMETHAMIGYRLVQRFPFLAGSAQTILSHHERFDGGGYPQGLKGEEIPLGARVFAVADAFDAMTSDRPYRKALSFAAAIERIRSESGRQFDPEIVRAFLTIPERAWPELQTAPAAYPCAMARMRSFRSRIRNPDTKSRIRNQESGN